jgi:hypothetical protein
MTEYLETYKNPVIVMEKIHGSNVQFTASWNGTNWDWLIGSRKRWVSKDEKFNNVQKIHASILHNLTELCDELRNDKEDMVIRFYGEVFGGKYGGESATHAIKTQGEVNYGPDNDVAFFDIIRNGKTVPIVRAIDSLEKHSLNVTPVIFRGNFANFVKSFNVNEFESRVSQMFYGLPHLKSPKGTEGVVIRTMCEDKADEDELIVLKWKQDWALENGRVGHKTPTPIADDNEAINACLAMLNQNRFESYASKMVPADLTDPRKIGSHVKAVIQDTMDDVNKEFTNEEYPELDRKLINKKLSQMAFPMFKKFLKTLELQSMTPEMRIKNLSVEGNNLSAEATILSQRLIKLQQRLAILG